MYMHCTMHMSLSFRLILFLLNWLLHLLSFLYVLYNIVLTHVVPLQLILFLLYMLEHLLSIVQ